MRAVKQILMAVLLAAIVSGTVSTGHIAFAQKNNNRPPKGDDRIKEQPKGNPPKNNNDSKNNNRHGKPN